MKNGNYCDCNRKNAIKFGGFKKSCTFANQKDVYPKFSLACAFRRGRASQGGGRKLRIVAQYHSSSNP